MADTQLLSREKEGLLMRKRAALMENIKLSADLWTALVKQDVLLEAEAEKIQVRVKLAEVGLVLYVKNLIQKHG